VKNLFSNTDLDCLFSKHVIEKSLLYLIQSVIRNIMDMVLQTYIK